MKKSFFKTFSFFLLTVQSFTLVCCSSGPKPLEVGKDSCELCKMTIMDKHFGAELITKKGKIYKFDSAECLIGYIKLHPVDKSPVRSLLVIDHFAPGVLINAETAFYLHSKNLPSPMGAYLAAVNNKETIDVYVSQFGGEAWTWNETCEHLW